MYTGPSASHLPTSGELSETLQDRIPQEIWENVIDMLWDHRPTLLACALTCRRWLPRSRHRLFIIIHLCKAQQLDGFSKLLAVTPSVDDLVRDLVIYYTRENTAPRPFSLFPILLARKLTKVEHIQFEGDYSVPSPYLAPLPGYYFLSLSQFTSVTKLSLCTLRFATFAEIRRVICALPNLSELCCIHLIWNTTGPVQPLARRPDRTPRLTSLRLDMRQGMTALADWFLSTATLESLHTVTLLFVDGSNFNQVARLTQGAGRCLRHFSIDMRTHDYQDPLLTRTPFILLLRASIQLTIEQWFMHNTSLESLRVRLLQGISDPARWATSVLSAVQSSVRRVTIGFSMWRSGVIQTDFQHVSQVLSSAKYYRLEELIIEWANPLDGPRQWKKSVGIPSPLLYQALMLSSLNSI